MNEAIKNLLTPQLKTWGGASGDNFSEELEEFAKRIIRECAKIAKNEQEFNDRSEIQVHIDQCILIHFGL